MDSSIYCILEAPCKLLPTREFDIAKVHSGSSFVLPKNAHAVSLFQLII